MKILAYALIGAFVGSMAISEAEAATKNSTTHALKKIQKVVPKKHVKVVQPQKKAQAQNNESYDYSHFSMY